MNSKRKIKVAVLRGGPSSEYEVSLKTGAGVLKNLPEHYQGIDVFIDKKGVWHIGGIPFDPKHLDKIADVVFIAMHGEYGEDGTVQRLLEQLHVPFTGSGSLASAIGMNKVLAKKAFIREGIKTPIYKVIEKDEYVPDHTALELYKTFPQPSVLKPVSGGSSVATSVAHTVKEIDQALRKGFEVSDKVLVEEYIKGKEATCGVLENFRGSDIYSLLPIEIVPKSHQSFFDYEAKYSDDQGAREICPGNFTEKESKMIQDLAILAHKSINARHYSRTDFILHPRRGIYCLEINTLPGLTPASLIPKAITAVGSSYAELLDHLLQLALNHKK
jgi:D-alanine-D-alanine ligase